jgi:hypothetical protein
MGNNQFVLKSIQNINTLCGQHTELSNVKPGDKQSSQWNFKGLKTHVHHTPPHLCIENLSNFVAFPHWNGQQCNLFYSATQWHRLLLIQPSTTLVPTSTLVSKSTNHSRMHCSCDHMSLRRSGCYFDNSESYTNKTNLKLCSKRSQG